MPEISKILRSLGLRQDFRPYFLWRLRGMGAVAGWTNVFIERVWRSLRYEEVYLKGYADGREAKAGISDWIIFYNERRLHQALGYRPPMAVWRKGAPLRPMDMWTTQTR